MKWSVSAYFDKGFKEFWVLESEFLVELIVVAGSFIELQFRRLTIRHIAVEFTISEDSKYLDFSSCLFVVYFVLIVLHLRVRVFSSFIAFNLRRTIAEVLLPVCNMNTRIEVIKFCQHCIFAVSCYYVFFLLLWSVRNICQAHFAHTKNLNVS